MKQLGAGLIATDCAFVCSKCGAEPRFTRRVDWGFNMADAYCPTDGCDGGVFRAKPRAEEPPPCHSDYPCGAPGHEHVR